MFKDKIANLFFLVAFILGMGFQIIFYKTKNDNWLLLSMWAPTLAVLALWKNGFPIFANLKKFKFKWVVLGIFLAFTPFILRQLFTWIFNLGEWNQAFILSADNSSIAEIKNIKLLLGNGSQSLFLFTLNIFITLTLGGIVTTFVAALGEEIGWRGFLQPYLSKKYGAILGTLFVGLIWAYWHIPANLGGVNGSENVFLNTFIIFPIIIIFMSFPLAWLRLRSEAIWPCAFFHGVNNAISDFALFKPHSGTTAQIIELASSILIGSLFIYLLSKKSHLRMTA